MTEGTMGRYLIQGNYGYGWETEYATDNADEANSTLNYYRENGDGSYRMVTRIA